LHAGTLRFARLTASRASAQHQDKSNDLVQTDFNFRVQAYGVRMAGKSLSVLKRHIGGGRTAP
jgi:hypothetical protein